MESNVDKDCGAYGELFLTIISDLRNSSPVWEDFVSKASKLHTSFKSTLLAIAAFLDAFQKVADMATGSRGATKEIGTALTRLCMRHKAIESKLKKITGTILDHLVNPLQDCMEDWKKTVVQLDKDRAKDYKKAKQDIKKSTSDTVRLQKKVKKASTNGTASLSPLWFEEGKQDVQSRLDSAMREVQEKYVTLEEQEKNAVRSALIEERGRFCHFVTNLKPFVDEEVSLLTEVTHLQEIMDSLCVQTDSPKSLPPSSEQVIIDLKGTETGMWKLQTPPSSPSSIGSRKSSMCSINSIASSSSGSVQSHSPCHKNIQQQQAQLLGSGLRMTSISSQDSGFTSQDTLFLRSTTPSSLNLQTQNVDGNNEGIDTPEVESDPSTPSEFHSNTISTISALANWPNPSNVGGKTESGRPHTISSAYEKSYSTRPALSSQLFEPPPHTVFEESSKLEQDTTVLKRERPQSAIAAPYSKPSASINKMQPVMPPVGPKPKSKVVAPPKIPAIDEQPLYANLCEMSYQGQTIDGDKTPTTSQPILDKAGTLFADDLDLTEAIRNLDNYTAALHGDFSSEVRKSKLQQNTIELAAAIKELQASTAALESYSSSTQASQSSLHSSSGYGTMDSTPAISEDQIASGDYLDAGQSDYGTKEHEKYFTIPRNNPISGMYRAAAFKRPASTTGISVYGQGGSNGGTQLMRRCSLNQPKPPPPVRRTSVMQQNPAALHKYHTSPRQLSTLAGDEQQNTQQGHRRSSSATGTDQEHTYAELLEIQQSIASRHQQQQMHEYCQSQGYHGGQPQYGANEMSVSEVPQYAQPVTTPSHTVLNSNVIDCQNAKFSAMNSQQTQLSQTVNEYHSNYPGHIPNAIETHCSGVADFTDLPPPPSEDELKQLQQIGSVPKQNIQQMHAYNVQTSDNVKIRHQPLQNINPATGVDMRQSLISELKAGNKFRNVPSNDGDSKH